MNSLFAPPELFAAYAYAEDGSQPEADLAPGTHLRIFAGLGGSFPLAPFAVFKLTARDAHPEMVHYTDRDGQPMDGLDLAQFGSGDATLYLPDEETSRTVRVDLIDHENGIDGALLLDQKGRVVAERREPRWLFAAPRLHKLRAWGASSAVDIRTKKIDQMMLVEGQPDLLGVLGLPKEGHYPWYVGLQDRAEGLARVARGAPLRLNPMDWPQGPLSAVGPDDEVARVEAMLLAGKPFGGGLEDLLELLVSEEAPAPREQIERQPMTANDGKQQVVAAQRLGALQMAALDPGIARFLGFADRYDELPDLDDGGGWDTLAIVGLFALDPETFVPYGLDLSAPTVAGQRLLDLLIGALEEAGGEDVADRIEESSAFVRAQGLIVSPFVTVVAPVPPWQPPSLPRPQILRHHWHPATGDTPSDQFRATFAFPRTPLVTMSALAYQRNGAWVSRHATVDVGALDPPQRARPRFIGHEQEAGARLRALNQPAGALEPAGLLSDQEIGAGAEPIPYRAWASDLFGRFGSPIDFTIAAPSRPKPPPPVLRVQFERAEVDAASPAKLSPGVLRLTVFVPRPYPADLTKEEADRLGSVIVVPRVADLAAGALPLATLELSLKGDPQPQAIESVDLSTPGFYERTIPLPGLEPQAKGSWVLRGAFKDTAGSLSDEELAAHPVTVWDTRPPQTYPAGIGLFWTSAPGPGPEVELKLTWPAKKDSLHRVYLADQHGLGLTGADIAEPDAPGVAPSRCRIAAVGCQKVLHPEQFESPAVDRNAFRLLTEQPIRAGADGRAMLVTTLPRSLTTVQFLRVVPLGPDGAEPAFDECGIVPVAVPESRRPAAPRLDGTVDPETGFAHLRIVADGFDRVALEQDEPGLFAPDAAGKEPPRFRIRRSVAAVPDPIYARPLGEGPLAWEEDEPEETIFAASFVDENSGRGLEPFVRYTYWAEVRKPLERRLPAGWEPLDGGVRAVDPASAANHLRPLSLPSASRTLMYVPAQGPAAPRPEAITAVKSPAVGAAVMVTVTVADPPLAHPTAIGHGYYRLAIWAQWPGQPIEPAGHANGAALEGTWPELTDGTVECAVEVPEGGDAAKPLQLRLAFVDPVGRLSPVTMVEAKEPEVPAPALGPIGFAPLVGLQFGPPPRLAIHWEITSPGDPQPADQYLLDVTIRVGEGPLVQPQTIRTLLADVPEAPPAHQMPPQMAVALMGRIGRVQGTQHYFVLMPMSNAKVEAKVTLTDWLGQSATISGRWPL